MKSVVVFILLLIVSISHAQVISHGFYEGEIVRKDGQVLKCLVENAVSYDASVTYKTSENGKMLSIDRDEIKSIRTPYKYIENIVVMGKERLMIMVTEGKVSLFSHTTVYSGSIPNASGAPYTPAGAPTVVYILKKGGIYYELKAKNYKTRLGDLLFDQPSVFAKVADIKYRENEFRPLIEEYNSLWRKQDAVRTITGRVIDSETKKPVKEAIIVVKNRTLETTSNVLGFFQLTVNIADTLVIEHPDYQSGSVQIPNTTNFQIPLSRQSKE